ncbi:MAG: endonuclease [Neorhizobium sp.]|jgi:endonuclease/exonuclease/phosphatase (EEP) superfamily protein YafD|nr:endonuclease [Neorhizobium sp.]
MSIRQTLHVVICVIVSLTLASIATRYIHPHWLVATLHSLQLHAAAGCIVAMLVALVLYRSMIGYLILIAAVLLTGHALWMTREFVSMASDADYAAPTFRLMSYNILDDNYSNSEAITRAIAASGADVVNVMEAEPLVPHLQELAKTYPYRIGCGVMVEDCDQLMLSKTPLENGSIRSLSVLFENRFILADVTIRGEKIHVAGIHTTKPYFDDFHALELVHAALAITDLDGPLVLSGDFNASSLEPDMRTFLRWTKLKTADWEPATWPVELGGLGMAIDHIYLRDPLKFRSIRALPSSLGSNHDGLIADIAITRR